MSGDLSPEQELEQQQQQQLRLFASYSPADVVLRYLTHPEPSPPSAPEQHDFDGAIGFVDVSGFTALSEKLNKDHGRKGAELLNTCARRSRTPSTRDRRAAPSHFLRASFTR